MSAICFGTGNKRVRHEVESRRVIEYRGDPSMPFVVRQLCDACIADVRAAGMEIKGEAVQVVDLDRELSFAEGFDDQTPEGREWLASLRAEKERRCKVSPEADKLIKEVADTSFACWAWTNQDEEEFDQVSEPAGEAENALRRYIAELESRSPLHVARRHTTESEAKS